MGFKEAIKKYIEKIERKKIQMSNDIEWSSTDELELELDALFQR